MAFNKSAQMEVDPTSGIANDLNGGGFDSQVVSPGTNYAFGGAAAVTAITDLTCAGAGSTFTSAALTALGNATIPGNFIRVPSGTTNLTSGLYEILSQVAGTFTVDRAISTGAVAAGTGRLGGPLATWQAGVTSLFCAAGAVTDSRLCVKKGTTSANVTLNTTSAVSASQNAARMTGYFAAHDDFPTIQSGNQPSYSSALTGATGVPCFTVTMAGLNIESLTFDGTSLGGTQSTIALSMTAGQSVIGCRLSNTSSYGLSAAANAYYAFCEVVSCVGGMAFSSSNMGAFNWIHKITGASVHGMTGAQVCHYWGNLITNVGTSGTCHGILPGDFGCVIAANTVWHALTAGLAGAPGQFFNAIRVVSNLSCKNAYGYYYAGGALYTGIILFSQGYNGFYGNSTANYNSFAAMATDVAMSATPFNGSDANNSAETTPDWTLNNNNPGGAQARGAGAFGVLPNGAATGYRDVGAIQHQDAGGASTFNRSLVLVDGVGLTSSYRG